MSEELPPASIAEIEQLVKRLYQSRSSVETNRIQEALQRLQRSPSGWHLADALLGSDDENVRFFGALTFTVKLNADWETLNDESARSVLYRLLYWLTQLVPRSDSPVVTRKLCSTLVVYFLRFPTTWILCVRHVICCLCQQDVLPLESLAQLPAMEDIRGKLGPSQAIIAMWFSSTLVEEVGKTDSNNLKSQSYHDKVLLNVNDAVSLMQRALLPIESSAVTESMKVKLKTEGIQCFQAWIMYSQRVFVSSEMEIDILTSLTQPAMHCFADKDMLETTAELFIEVLSNFPAFLKSDDYISLTSLIHSQWAQDRLDLLKGGDFSFESLQFGRFLLAFGDAIVPELVRTPDSVRSTHTLLMLHELLKCEGVAVAEDDICSMAVEFWTTFVEFILDSLFADGDDARPVWMRAAREHIAQALQECWEKIRIPDLEITVAWDSDVRKGFKDFRKDVADLVQSSYSILGTQIFGKFVDMALISLEHLGWEALEASLFYVNALSDSIGEGQAEDADLKRLFESAIFTACLGPDSDQLGKPRQTLVSLLGHYASFFERHTEYLPAALRFLFQCLDAAPLVMNASKSIASLCSSCRRPLTSELNAFIQHYEAFLSAESVDSTVKDKVLGAIACILQALPSDQEKAVHLQRLLVFVQRDVYACLVQVTRQDLAEAEEAGTIALRSLCSIGKGMQDLNDAPIELDSETPRTTFWDQGEGAQVQTQILRLVEQVFEAMPHNSAIVEAACAVFRTGFTEVTPGPFVFSPQITTQFLLRSSVQSPQLGLVLTTACALISSHSGEFSVRIDSEANALLRHVVNYVHESADPHQDPEIAQNCVDFLSRLVPRYVNVMVQFEPSELLQGLLIFTLKCLAGGDILPKRSAAGFWASFIVLFDQPEPLQLAINNIMQHLGPSLAEALIINMGGNAARSELDTLVEPLKKMVFKQPRAKAWLEEALFKETFPSNKVDANGKRLFLQKVMSLRGAKGTNQIVKDFWVACRGMNFAYAS